MWKSFLDAKIFSTFNISLVDGGAQKLGGNSPKFKPP